MRIVIDTNVVISDTFFGGNPRNEPHNAWLSSERFSA